MFPASLTMIPLASLPPMDATIVSIDARVVLGTLVLAIVITAGLLVQRALTSTTKRTSSRLRVVPRHAH